jgi:hydroxymethylglutaryl-CoA reductase (NADPH)
MPTPLKQARSFVERHLGTETPAALRTRLQPNGAATRERIPGGTLLNPERVNERWRVLNASETTRAALADVASLAGMEAFARNIENFVGTLKVPVGIAGPLRINGLFAHGDFYIPLATTEAALVASFDRGARVLTEAGGCTVMLLNEGVSRAPGFAFKSLADAGEFVLWAMQQTENFRTIAEGTTQHGHLTDVRVTVEGNHVYLHLEFTTGGAAGQNMVTIATSAVCDYIREHTPVQAEYWFVEANLSGDKKASVLAFTSVRGKKVSAEICLPAEIVERRLHTTPLAMERYWRMSALGGVMSGTIGVQGHYANGLAALYLATGQDVACVAESAVGVTRMERREDGCLYAAVTLPNVIVGTVGGGTGLPSQRACLELLGLAKPDGAPALAEVCAALALAGELSIIAALSAQEFARAHKRLARGKAKSAAAK